MKRIENYYFIIISYFIALIYPAFRYERMLLYIGLILITFLIYRTGCKRKLLCVIVVFVIGNLFATHKVLAALDFYINYSKRNEFIEEVCNRDSLLLNKYYSNHELGELTYMLDNDGAFIGVFTLKTREGFLFDDIRMLHYLPEDKYHSKDGFIVDNSKTLVLRKCDGYVWVYSIHHDRVFDSDGLPF
ncbi:MAG: hypothetical protein ACPH9Q_08200 [Schleiferiaceae bacterium]|jgi:hypothetical protein